MECSTVYCDPDEFCLILDNSMRTARKEHKCGECRRIIAPKEKYRSETTLFDGKIEWQKTCVDCISVIDEFFKAGYFYGETKWMLRDHIGEVGGDVSESCLASLTPGARAMVCQIIEETWEEVEE